MNKETQIQKNPRRKRRRINQARLALALFCAILVAVGGIVTMVHLNRTAQADKGLGAFNVKAVTASGSAYYTEQELVLTSQIAVGQSIFSIDEQRAVNNLFLRFPYLDSVEIQHPTYDTVHISVRETAEMGAVQSNSGWLIVGQNGRGLRCIPRTAQQPHRYLYLSGITVSDTMVGKAVLSEEQLKLVHEIAAACVQYGLSDVGEICVQAGNIQLVWRAQITVLLGDASALSYQMQVLANSLPKLLEKYGQHICAQYDLRAFADPTESDPQGYFTPIE